MAVTEDLARALADVLDVLEGRVARIDPHTAAAHRANLAAAVAPDAPPVQDAAPDTVGAPEPGPQDGE